MTDYKSTLNLPQTDFPMKANLPQREPELLLRWQSIDIYQKLCEANAGKKAFILHWGPPYANGHIHLGHATNGILKDIIVKSKILFGYNSPLIMGWDCHGLPIELLVEKKHGKPGKKISANEFRNACREVAASFINIQREEFKRLGIITDWDHPYKTMDYKYEADIIRSLAKIISGGHVVKGYKPVHWCLDCASALAEAEVEYQDKKSSAIDVRFFVVNEDEFYQRFAKVAKANGKISIPIWTTTPWSLPGNQAVALNEKLKYDLVAIDGKEIILIAEDLLQSVLKRYDVKEHQVLGSVMGAELGGVKLQHPFYDKHVPVILSDHVTIDSGTGAVHIAPAHGEDDFNLGVKYKLTLDNPVADDGCYTSTTPLFAGQHVSKVNDVIVETLKEKNTLLHYATLVHSYPHCWRHKTPIIFRATPQWFVSMDKNGLREKALSAIDRVEWIPDWGKGRIKGMIQNRPDWCISRQRTWGTPMSLFLHKETGDMHPNTLELMEKVAQRVEKEGIEAWFSLDEKEFLGTDADKYVKARDTLDVWFDSGVSHECVLRQRSNLTFPTDIVLEGSDQHRGWFQSLLLTSVAMNGVEPYKEVLTHGFTVDSQGRKMSKSLGNVVSPEEVVQHLGADILRLWVSSVDYRNDFPGSKEILNRTSEAYRRIRNTARFLLANLNGFDPTKNLIPHDQMLKLDRWAVARTKQLQQEILEAYESYQFHLIYQKLHNFCINDLGGFYLDIIKDRQYTMSTDSIGRRSAQTALYHIANALVRWMAPIMTFTAEEIWQYMPGNRVESVLLSSWYNELADLDSKEAMNNEFWDKIRNVRDAVNKEIETQRAAGKLGSALEAEVTLYCGEELYKQLKSLDDELRFVLITSYAKVEPVSAAPMDIASTDIPGLSVKVNATSYIKCERCWHRREDVNSNPEYPGICIRCVENISGTGEIRKYA